MKSILKNNYVRMILIFAIGSIIGYFSKPNKVIEIEKVKEVKIESNKENRDIKKNTVTVKKKDGTVIIREKFEDKTRLASDKSSLTEKEKTKIIENKSKFSGSIMLNPTAKTQPLEGVQLEYRVFGNAKIGSYYLIEEKRVGITLGIDF